MLIAAWPAHAAIAVVQKADCQSTGATSCTTGAITTTTGNLVATGHTLCCNGAFGTSVISDSKVNSWSNAITANNTSNSEVRIDYSTLTSGGGSHTFTATVAAGFYGILSAIEISGQAASPLDQTASGTGTSTSGATSATPATSQASEALIGVGNTETTPSITYTNDSGAGWTEQTNVANDAGGNIGGITGSKIVAATGTYTYTFTMSSAGAYSAAIATFKASASSRQRCIGCGTDKKVIGD